MRLGDAKHVANLTVLPLIIRKVTIRLLKNYQCSAINVVLIQLINERIPKKVLLSSFKKLLIKTSMIKNHSFTSMIQVLGVLFLVGLSGCQNVTSSDKFVSAGGVNIEAMLPANMVVFIKAGTKDKTQLEAMKILNGYFPNNPLGKITEQFNQGLKDGSKLEEEGLSFEKDLLPMISDQTELYFAVSPKDGLDDLKNPEALFAMTLADQSKFDQIVKAELDKGKLQKVDYNGAVLYTKIQDSTAGVDQSGYFARVNDVAFMATSKVQAQSILDNLKNNQVKVADNKAFQKAKSKNQESLLLAYIDLNKLLSLMSKASGDEEGVQTLKQALKTSGVDVVDVDVLESETISVSAEREGLSLNISVFTKAKADLSKLKMVEIGPMYLAKKIPAVSTLIYLESSGLKGFYQSLVANVGSVATMAKDLQAMKVSLSEQGMDLDKDLLSFLDKGYALSIDDSGFLIPNFGFYLDASSNPDGAVKVAKKLDEVVNQMLNNANINSPQFSTVLTREEMVPGKLWKIKFVPDLFLTALPQIVAKKLSGQKYELYYGLNADNVLLVAFQPDLERNWGGSTNVASGQEFSIAEKFIKGADKGVTYLSPNQVVIMLDRLMNLAVETGAPVDRTEYDLVKSYLIPVKSVIFGYKGMEQGIVQSLAFIHIAQ